MIRTIDLPGRTLAVSCHPDDSLVLEDGAAVLTSARFAVLHDMPDGEVYRHGHNSWSPCGWRPLSAPPLRIEDPVRRRTADDDRWDDPVRHHSSWVAVLEDRGHGLLVGALEGETPRLRADTASLEAFTETGRPGRWRIAAGRPTELLTAYAQAVAAVAGRRPVRPQSVWSSWYSYYETVSEEAIASEVAGLAGLGVRTIQVDDGWERSVGDWEAGERFGSGMASTARTIRDAGFEPGLWLAPFIAVPGSRTALERPELFVTDPSGRPAVAGTNWGVGYYALDLTRADAQEHVAEVVRRVVHDWGFTYLKLDFIYAAAVPGVRREPVDRERAYRRGLEVVREAAGEQAHLLGCGALPLASLGLLDSIRVGPDVAPLWDNYASTDPSDATARNALSTSAGRLWLGEVIGIDPDVVLFRHRRNLLSDEQMGWLRDLAAACRFRCLSDPCDWLDEAEREAVREFLARSEEVELTGRYRFRLDGREVDLSRAVAATGGAYPL
ncbi:glycoside hydrolase family 36 protein [Actinomyces howellii]|uniref:Alpha-galactosidase n=1 Tax=Actinomyces howellii TaxID=52771 RepID=A0A3S4UY35_9ACTO|nr:glycoside hydrolase family 36 protein [Actinomyces howellii]VEG28810.1 Alpha-galactosidase [Actinomyces howellii]